MVDTDVGTFNAIIPNHGRLHQVEKMHDILRPIKEIGFNLDLITYSMRNMCGRNYQYTNSK
jgi:hypothetical protein